ncbi:oligosaccharide flippase family protein [Alteromonas macleodii]|uniref:oligosaccharide flippase family protein n=1 Tax=Alteromonas TaxID=226 RepID=UPI000C551E21|nr:MULTISPECIES: oligosaccharide flippase family protein [Alteromonas]MBE91052.1 hypothetical protein [Rhodospirillaceae bacterium]PXW71541.1 O-antigen/teichoic acid export membrane protein [Alteromonas sp. I10]|tara:strand:+ start:24462 stop:25940 length:1479 start_codon:yes stop_codon:yes gene_type:complete
MSIQKKLTVAYLWNLLGKWGVRFIGIGSTLVLVRLLDPSAFGLVALATICIGFFETLTDIGINRYLISQTQLDKQAMDSSWTVALLLKIALIFLIIALSGFLADFMNAPEIQLIIVVVACSGIFSALNNIGLVQFEKELDFKRVSALLLSAKLVSTAVMLVIAFWLQNYWALVAGGVCNALVYCIGSYQISSYRPELNFNIAKGQLRFSGKIMVRAVLGYTRNKLDTFLVGRLFDNGAVGKYSIGLEFAVLPLAEVITPASTAMFPALAGYKNNKQELFDKTYKYFGLVYGFVMPCVVGIWFVAPQFCDVILGPKWADTAPVMAALSVMMLPYPLTAITNNLFDYLDKTQYSLFSDSMGIALLVGAFCFFTFSELSDFAWARGVVALIAFLCILIFTRLTIGLSIKKMSSVLLLPSLAASAMWSCLEYGYHFTELSLLALVGNITIGAVAYSMALSILLRIFAKFDPTWEFWWIKLKTLPVKLYTELSKNHA